MLQSIRRSFRNLKNSTSGNATMLVALGLPVLIGGSGLAVDTAQWYMWKREIQYAADQAALAGAWARSNDKSKDSYITRAKQEFAANLSTTRDITTEPVVRLAYYNSSAKPGTTSSSTENSVVVTADASKILPFSSFLTKEAATVSVYSQASFNEGERYTACLIATDEDDSGAITIGGNAKLTAACGIAALSTSDSSIVINGNPTLDPGWVLSKGGIDDWLNEYTDAEIREYLEGLTDPFADLTTPTPNPNPVQTYRCIAATTTTTGDRRTKSDIIYTYWQGSSTKNATQLASYSGSGFLANFTGPWTAWTYNVALPLNTPNGTTTTEGAPTWTSLSGSGQKTVWRKAVTRTTTEVANSLTVGTNTQATLNQGTYRGGFDVGCTTVLNPGIYVIDGGRIKITGQYQVTGAGILIILKNGAYFDITGGSNIALTAATAAQLSSVGGLSNDQAQQFAGMLVYEDRASEGSGDRNSLNGNAETVLNGKFYLPKSGIRFSGSASVTSGCLLIAAANITLEGDLNMSSFCDSTPPPPEDAVYQARAKVRLVA
ncbi:pilus assembly protein TadG-related protein [Novosphingobium sp.]|uniref:pilus assembly protein TadG-related protein n=1 Tax=Novosphingobium sp. TaxID=1874826 RepID=UPI0035B39814